MLQTTIGFPIHISYKTCHFVVLYKIPKSSTTTINHSNEKRLINFHFRKNMNIGSSQKC